jgi:LysM repeat protein
MSTPNPLQPQGSLAAAAGKSNIRLTVLAILAIHVAVLGGLLLQGCGKEKAADGLAANPPAGDAAVTTTDLPPLNPSPYFTNDPSAFIGAGPFATGAVPAAPATNAYAGVPPAAYQAATSAVAAATPPDAALAPVTEYAAPTRHTIQKGDTLGALAKRHGVSVKAIEQLNPGVNPTRLKIGQEIELPAGKAPAAAVAAADPAAAGVEEYTVKSGDTLTRIGRKFGTTPKALRQLNSLKSDRIMVGQKLKVPAAAAAPPPAAAGQL